MLAISRDYQNRFAARLHINVRARYVPRQLCQL